MTTPSLPRYVLQSDGSMYLPDHATIYHPDPEHWTDEKAIAFFTANVALFAAPPPAQ